MYLATARSLPRGSAPSRRRVSRRGARMCRIRWTARTLARDSAASRPPGAAGRQLGIHRPHRGPELREVQGVERRDRQLRRVEAEPLGGDPRHQPRLQEDVQLVLVPARAHPGWGAGRHQRDRRGGGRYVPLHPFVQQVQLLRRPGDEDEPVVDKGGRVVFKGGPRAVASCLQAHPPQPVARRGRLERDDLAQCCKGPERAAEFRFFLSH